MNRNFFALMMMLVALALSGCGGGDDRPLVRLEIVSDAAADGDIERIGSSFTINQNVPSLFAGRDPVFQEDLRAFLDFPLDNLPVNARIQSARLDVVIRSVDAIPSTATVPIRIELVQYPPTALAAVHYDQPALIGTSIITSVSFLDIPTSPTDGRSVSVDVTPLLVAAQARGLSDFQIRILQDSNFAQRGVIEIDDDLDPPLLFVNYF
jgi:hypothetical protein